MLRYRATASAALLALLGAMLATAPASAAATAPAVRLSGELVQVADQQGAGFAAIRLAAGPLTPIRAESVKGIASGSEVTLDVVIPAVVQVAAAASRPPTTQGVDGRQVALPLRASDLAAASDGSPEASASAIGKATVAAALAPGMPPLEVSKVLAAAADPASTYTPATHKMYVAVVTPAGGTLRPPVDENRIRAQVAGASSYWSDVTGGGVTLSVETIEDPYDYGDGQDVMSASPKTFAPFLSAPQSLRTGFIPPSAATVIDAVGTQNVTLLALAGGVGMRTAEVVNPPLASPTTWSTAPTLVATCRRCFMAWRPAFACCATPPRPKRPFCLTPHRAASPATWIRRCR